MFLGGTVLLSGQVPRVEISNTATVNISIAPVNDAPGAFDGTLDVTEDMPATSFFSTSDVDSILTTVEVVTPPAHGTVTIPNPSGAALGGVSFIYAPSSNYNGPDSFTFRAREGGLSSNVATIDLTVAPVNDAPVANSVVVATQEGLTQAGTLTATDVDSGVLTFSIVTRPTKGTLTITSPATGAFTYTPNAGAIGYDTFTFLAADGSGASSSGTGMAFIVASSPQWPGQTVRVSVASNGMQGNNESSDLRVSADGRYVAFTSRANNLVPGDTNNESDVFVHDRQTGQTTRVSVASNGSQANASSSSGRLSADGRFVAFASVASNLVPGDTNGTNDVFVRDRQTGETTRVSVASDGSQGTYGGDSPALSADGRYVAFSTTASNFVAGDTNGVRDVFVHDRQAGRTTRVSVASDGSEANDHTGIVGGLSADGRYVAFQSSASNLVVGDTNGVQDAFVHDQITRQTTRVNIASDGSQTQTDANTNELVISANGRFVAFYSVASNLVPDDTNASIDVFVRDLQTGTTTRASVTSDGQQSNGFAWGPAISADGRYVAFYSSATNLVEGDTNGEGDVFVRDLQTGVTTRVGVASSGVQPDRGVGVPAMSADGRFVGFSSALRTNLVPSDTNNLSDVFVVGGVTISPTTFSVPGTGGSGIVNVSFGYPGTFTTATTTTPWITLMPAVGASTLNMGFSAAPNTGAARIGTLVVEARTITVEQGAFDGGTRSASVPVGSPVSVDLPGAPSITLTFPSVTQPGVVTATPMSSPPASADFLLTGTVWDIVATATYTPPVTVCFTGTYGVSSLLHYESGTWRNVTTSRTATQICGQVSSLSPFAIGQARVANNPPLASAGGGQVIEATSSAGVTVSLVGTGSDPDAGDTITFKWTEGAATLGTTASVNVVMSVGTHDLTLTVTDNHGATAVATTRVVVRDTKAPVVTPPADITVPRHSRPEVREALHSPLSPLTSLVVRWRISSTRRPPGWTRRSTVPKSISTRSSQSVRQRQ